MKIYKKIYKDEDFALTKIGLCKYRLTSEKSIFVLKLDIEKEKLDEDFFCCSLKDYKEIKKHFFIVDQSLSRYEIKKTKIYLNSESKEKVKSKYINIISDCFSVSLYAFAVKESSENYSLKYFYFDEDEIKILKNYNYFFQKELYSFYLKLHRKEYGIERKCLKCNKISQSTSVFCNDCREQIGDEVGCWRACLVSEDNCWEHFCPGDLVFNVLDNTEKRR